MTVSAKITQWEEGATSVSLDITIYRLITRLVAKVTQFFLSFKLFVTFKSYMYVVAWIAWVTLVDESNVNETLS